MAEEFDLINIFWGETTWIMLLEIGFRTTVLFVFTLFLMRFVGHRGVGQLSMTEFILILALGSAVGDPMFYLDIPLVHGMAVITLIVVYQVLLTTLSMNFPRIANLEEGTAIRLVVDGIIDLEGLHQARLTHEELFAELRQEGIRELGEVERAYLEIDGQVSVFRSRQACSGLSLMPDDVKAAPKFKQGDRISEKKPYTCINCAYTDRLEAGSTLSYCPRCQHSHWMPATIPPDQ